RALGGALRAAAGTIDWDARRLSGWSARGMSRRRAVLPQHHRVGFGFTAEEIVRMGRAPWARTDRSADDDRVVVESMRACEVEDLHGRTFGTLSGGEQARVALARVLAQQTETVLLDEPTAALDLRHQETIMR